MERGLGSDCWCRIRRHPIDPSRSVSAQILEADVEFFDGEGEPIGSIESIQVEALTARATAGAPRRSDLAKLEWKALEPEIENPSRAKLEKTVERWVLISDSAVEASAFAAELEKEGGTSHFCEKVEDLPRLAAQMERDSHRSWGLLLLAWRNGAADAEPEADRQFRVGSWAAAIRDHCDTAQQVWIATSGLQRVAPRDPEIAPLAPIIAKEIETFASCVDLQRCRLFDAGARVEHAERLALASLVGSESDERQYVAREKELFVPRLVESGGAERSSVSLGRPAAARNFRAVHRGAEGADCLALEEVCDPDGIEGSVVVAVRSAALSQLDVLTGLGLARGPVTGPRSVAMDFSGVVLAVGDAHGDYRVGDEVVGVSAGALARRIVVPTSSVVQKPAGFDFHEAACLPLPYLAAQYSLKVVARLRAGERVLVKSAGGGMGQAMVAVARKLGAEVTATASTKLRREALQALGARVLDEWPGRDRGDDFDLIVTAESGAPFHDSLARLAPGGRALDLCPRNGFVRPEIGSLRLAANRSVSSIDIVAMMEDQPSLIFGLLDGLPKAATEGHLPLTAPAVFPLSEAGRALRFMAQNRHVGRVCVDLSAAEDAIVEVRPVAPVSIDGAGPFVVSGADRDVLDAIANRLREEGARRVIVTDSARLTDVLKGLVKERLGGWIHLTTGSTRGVEETLRMAPALVRADVDLRLLVSTREAFSGDPAADRSWETRSWIDRLLLPEAEGEGANSQLSLAADTAPDRIADRVAAVVLGRCADGCLVSLSDRDRRQRGVEAPAPFFQDLEARDEGGVSSTFELSALIEKSPPERRAALQDLVCGTLAGVLALSDEQREAIDLGSRIDELGLDSLMTLEVFLGLGRDLELEIELNWFETIPTLAEIAVVLLDRLAARESEAS
jgi:NADPH:quinone reductase-like Zn-dependent oxidoreductase/acyl carrier protein